ncbi:MAG: leucyl aminopeptidase [Solirubrobacteraceae bacterium]|nr:leucyl aminopeptidase [Solirubrobacteraceae bacterium]
MRVEPTTEAPVTTDADTIVIGLLEGEGVPHDVDDGALGALLEAGEAKAGFRKLAVAHAAGKRWILVGLGARDELTPERMRVAAAVAHGRARELGARTLCWEAPHKIDSASVGALVEGTVLHAYRFDRYRGGGADDDGREVERLVVSAHDDPAEPVRRAEILARAQNRARDLQNTPANDMTPTALAARARELADEHGHLSLEVLGRAELVERGMGAFAAVAQGSYEEPQLIALRYNGPEASGPVLGLVGKAVTFDTGGISIKPAAKMHEMKFDMSGGAAVLETMGALAELELPVRVLAVIGATENMPSGRSMKPGDIVRAANGVSIEINNTDAEGRLVLADCLCHARDGGAERLVDIATLTGGVVVALGSTFAGLMANDDAWAAEVQDAGTRSGEELWRLPLHEEYAELIKGRYGDIVNAPEARKAQSITAAEFLKRFVEDVPWAHVDIAGVAYDGGRAYASKGGNGFGVRLLVELAGALQA